MVVEKYNNSIRKQHFKRMSISLYQILQDEIESFCQEHQILSTRRSTKPHKKIRNLENQDFKNLVQFINDFNTSIYNQKQLTGNSYLSLESANRTGIGFNRREFSYRDNSDNSLCGPKNEKKWERKVVKKQVRDRIDLTSELGGGTALEDWSPVSGKAVTGFPKKGQNKKKLSYDNKIKKKREKKTQDIEMMMAEAPHYK